MPVRSIYGAYGIRGIWGQDLDEVVAVKLAKAFVTKQRPRRVVVGRDGRRSSQQLGRAFVGGLRDLGVDIVDIGLVSVDAFYFAVMHLRTDGGAMVTASHNPPEWNGVKFVDGRAQLLVGEQNRELGQLVDRGSFTPASAHQGRYERVDMIPDFVHFIVSQVDLAHVRPLKVVVDPGNGPAALVASALFKRTPFAWSGIHMEVDGLFPGRDPDPKKPGALDKLGQGVRDREADLGVAFDADGDRLFLVDERGAALSGETTGLMLARAMLRRNPGGSVVYNVVCSHAVPEYIRAWGGQPVRAGVGSVNMKPALARSRALVGIETSGHYIIPALNFIDSGLVPMAYVLEELANQPKPLSALAAQLDPYVHEFLDLPCEAISDAKERIRKAYASSIVDELDGLTVELPHAWFNVRASNTEPLLRLTVEATTRDKMERCRDELLRMIQSA